MNRIRTLAVCVAAIAAAGGMTACTSSAGTSGDSSTTPTSVAPTSVTTTVVTTAAAPASTSASASSTGSGDSGSGGSGSSGSGSGGTSQCAESQLRASVAGDNIPGLDRHVVKVSFLNKSGSTCTLTGYPGAAIEDSSNKQVEQATRVIGGPVGGTVESTQPVTLRSGATAYAYLEGSSTREVGAAQAGCDAAAYPRILITPPNTKIAVPFSIGWPQCYSFQIHPVRSDT